VAHGEQGGDRNLLQSLQGSHLRTPVWFMKTTPMEVQEVALCQAPVDLAAIEAAGLTAYRLKSGRMEARIPTEIPLHIKSG
jgi:hypothetical protein